jgi:hypothetical protein
MELNRSVCLERIEGGVPWFHEKYCRSFHAGREFLINHDFFFSRFVQIPPNAAYLFLS